MQYPYWIMAAGAILVMVGFVGLALRKNKVASYEMIQTKRSDGEGKNDHEVFDHSRRDLFFSKCIRPGCSPQG
jgi:hypothetical protein